MTAHTASSRAARSSSTGYSWWSRDLVYQPCSWEWAIRSQQVRLAIHRVLHVSMVTVMLKLLLGVLIEVFIAVSLAGAALALRDTGAQPPRRLSGRATCA